METPREHAASLFQPVQISANQPGSILTCSIILVATPSLKFFKIRKHGVEDAPELVGNQSVRSTTWPLDPVSLPSVVVLPLNIFLDCAQGMVPHDVVHELRKQ
jgi:hypothetical protein